MNMWWLKLLGIGKLTSWKEFFIGLEINLKIFLSN